MRDCYLIACSNCSPGVVVAMRCYYADYTGTLQPAAETEEVVWLTYQNRDQVSPVDQIIFDWLLEGGLLPADQPA